MNKYLYRFVALFGDVLDAMNKASKEIETIIDEMETATKHTGPASSQEDAGFSDGKEESP